MAEKTLTWRRFMPAIASALTLGALPATPHGALVIVSGVVLVTVLGQAAKRLANAGDKKGSAGE